MLLLLTDDMNATHKNICRRFQGLRTHLAIRYRRRLLPASRSGPKPGSLRTLHHSLTVKQFQLGLEELKKHIYRSRPLVRTTDIGYGRSLSIALYSENIPWEGINSCRRRRTVFLLNCSADSRFTVDPTTPRPIRWLENCPPTRVRLFCNFFSSDVAAIAERNPRACSTIQNNGMF